MTLSSLTPSSVTLQSGQQQQFTVSASGASNQNIAWSIVQGTTSHYSGDSTVGTISSSGLYTAPTVTAPITLTLYAAAAADTSISRTAAITVSPLPPPITVSITPTSGAVQTCPAAPCPANAMVAFSAAVANTANQAVTWEVNGVANGNSTFGTISNSGVYTAPAAVPSPASATVKAVSQADATATATALVAITAAPPPVAVSLNQTAVTLTAGGSFGFIATVTPSGLANSTVSWSVTCSAGSCGTIAPAAQTSQGVNPATYQAPSSVSSSLTVTVTATSAQDTSKSAHSTVTVNPLLAPTLTIAQSVDTSTTPLVQNTSMTLTATVNNLPSGTPQPAIDWTQGSAFCVSSDEESPAFDNCGPDTDGDGGLTDGAGLVTAFSAGSAQATYKAPFTVYWPAGVGFFVQNNCSQATPAQTNPWVYVIATATVNGTAVTGSTCIQVQP